jgi:hypothetical protein
LTVKLKLAVNIVYGTKNEKVICRTKGYFFSTGFPHPLPVGVVFSMAEAESSYIDAWFLAAKAGRADGIFYYSLTPSSLHYIPTLHHLHTSLYPPQHAIHSHFKEIAYDAMRPAKSGAISGEHQHSRSPGQHSLALFSQCRPRGRCSSVVGG